MIRKRGYAYPPNLLKSILKTFYVSPFLLLALGCDFGVSSESRIGGSHAYFSKLEVENVKSGEESSSVAVKFRILTHEDKDVTAGEPAFDLAVKVQLKWKCWQWEQLEGESESSERELDNGKVELNVAAGAGSGTVTISDLPGTGDSVVSADSTHEDSIHCVISVEGATIQGDSPALKDLRERFHEDVVIDVEEGFEISLGDRHQGAESLALQISDIVPGQSNSQAKITLTAGRYFNGFKAAVAGDRMYDDAININLEWSCGHLWRWQ